MAADDPIWIQSLVRMAAFIESVGRPQDVAAMRRVLVECSLWPSDGSSVPFVGVGPDRAPGAAEGSRGTW